MKKISKKEKLISTREKIKNVLLPASMAAYMLAAPLAVGASIVSLTGCSSDEDAPKNDRTAIIVNGDHALLVEIGYYHSETVGKTDKQSYSLNLADNKYGYIEVVDDEDTDVIIVDDVNSMEKAKLIASTVVGENGVIEVYGADTKTLTYSNN